MELQNIRRIGVFKLRNIGDVLLITPFLRALRGTFPAARITVVVTAGTEAMLAGNPHVDEVLPFARDRKGFSPLGRLAYELRFLRQLRARRFDLTISLTEGDRAAWHALFSGARHRLGRVHHTIGRHDPRRRIYNLPCPSALPRMHEVEQPFHLLREAGLALADPRPGPLCLAVPEERRAWARRELEPLRPRRVVQVHPVSRWLFKCWVPERMAAVIDWLQDEMDTAVVVTTGPIDREREHARRIVALCRRPPRFYDGSLSLEQMAALSAEADGYFGVDTAPMHIAAAAGAPVVALFGPTGTEAWRPWTDRARVLTHGCPCIEARRRQCDWGQVRACLATITIDEAKAALRELVAPRSGQLSTVSL